MMEDFMYVISTKKRKLYILTTWQTVLFSKWQSQPMLLLEFLGGSSVTPTIWISHESPLSFQYVAPKVLVISWRTSTYGHPQQINITCQIHAEPPCWIKHIAVLLRCSTSGLHELKFVLWRTKENVMFAGTLKRNATKISDISIILGLILNLPCSNFCIYLIQFLLSLL